MADYTFHKIEMIVAIPNYLVEADFAQIDPSLWVTVSDDALILGMSDSELRLTPIPTSE